MTSKAAFTLSRDILELDVATCVVSLDILGVFSSASALCIQEGSSNQAYECKMQMHLSAKRYQKPVISGSFLNFWLETQQRLAETKVPAWCPLGFGQREFHFRPNCFNGNGHRCKNMAQTPEMDRSQFVPHICSFSCNDILREATRTPIYLWHVHFPKH